MTVERTDEQRALRAVARDLFAAESPPSRLRETWNGEPRDRRVWKAMANAGLLGIVADGGGFDDLAVVIEEAGRAALPEPLIDTVAVAATLVERFGSPAQRDEWLGRIAAGDATIAALPHGAPFAADADEADAMLVSDATSVRLVPRGSFTATRVASEDRARRLFRIDVTGDGSLLEGATHDDLIEVGAAATAMFLCGLASQMLETTVAYVREREQFGRPVGSFQAVKHKLASVWVRLEAARAASWEAAEAQRSGGEATASARRLAASVAKAAASDAEASAGAEALQCHGGIGFTWEHDLHLWLKRGLALRYAYGSASEHRARIAAAAFDSLGGSDA